MPTNTIPAPQVDFITNGRASAGSSVAMRLLQNGFNVEALRPDADSPHVQGVLRKDEWTHFDNAVIPVARARLVAVGDLVSRGLTMNLPNALGTTRLEWERISDMDPAMVSMSGVNNGSNDRMTFDLQSLPIPIIHRDFFLNIRALEASRKGGMPLDTTQAQMATRLVAEKVEEIFFKGATVGSGGNNTIYGLTTQPSRNTGAVTAAWLSATGEQILGDVNTMIGTAIADNMYGPYILYVPLLVNNKLDNDFKAASDKSIRSRLLEIPDISAIKATPNLTGSNVVLMQASSDTVDIIDGLQPTVLMWEGQGGMIINFKVMSIMVPRFKVDLKTQCGIVHFS